MPGVVGRFVRAMGLAVSMTAAVAGHCEASPAAGMVITNTVTAQYADPHGTTYGVQSNTVATSIAAVSAVVVSPKETAADPASEGYPAGTPMTRTFTIVNGGNVPDAYMLSSVTAGAGAIASIAFVAASGAVPATVGSTVSPVLQPGDAIKVQVVVADRERRGRHGVPDRRDGALDERDDVQRPGERQRQGMGARADGRVDRADPAVPATSINKLVNQVRTHTANPGETVTYSIVFKNYGGSPATNVVVVDDVPAGITALPQTAAINGVPVAQATTLAGQRLTVKAGTLAVGAVDTLTFDAVVQNGSAARRLVRQRRVALRRRHARRSRRRRQACSSASATSCTTATRDRARRSTARR